MCGMQESNPTAASVTCSFVFEQSFEHADGGMERRAPAFGCFAVPAAIFELLAQELIGQCVVRFFEIRAGAEDSAVDARLRFAVKERPVVERLKHEPLVDAVDHFASLLAGWVDTEVLQDDESVEDVISKPRSSFGPPQLPAGDWSARSRAPQPSVAT